MTPDTPKPRKRNLEVSRAQSKRWYADNKAHRRAYELKRNFNMTSEDYDNMLAAQDFRCATCLTDTPGGNSQYFHVDHCHNTNVVRGLLCSSCNRGIGMLKDDVSVLQRAIDYLNSAKKKALN